MVMIHYITDYDTSAEKQLLQNYVIIQFNVVKHRMSIGK